MSKMNRAMLIGSIGAGKSTLTNALLGRKAEAVKTQALNYYDWIVDTPGEYTENPFFYKNIMATALEVTHVLYLQDSTKRKTIFPPGFSTGFNKLPIGIVTKSDSAQADVNTAIRQLRNAVPKGPIVISSSISGKGIEEIRSLVKCHSFQEMKDYAESLPDDVVIFK
ncbi:MULTISPECIES: EutP/PduV family microcompartment system protein [Cytobacillus]|uniref:EutP/PduV family microcompartment system protein n=1 Tax=Cytobacillus TaxID=2675230 RepID=UPI0020406FE7|nr:EutP/PduV family microcompartment system protein [Cytobacillus firmus]MCM3707535.1 EutP/PduV family microcompartment system protein [Cytobacillus firmus]